MTEKPYAWVPDPFAASSRGRLVVCPVNDLLWRHLAGAAPGTTAGIIVQVRPSASAPTLATWLRRTLDGDEIVAYADYVRASARFDQLLTELLPLTTWAGFVQRAAAAVEYYARATGGSSTPSPSRRSLPVDWSADDSALLRWLTGHVVAAHRIDLPEREPDRFPVPHVLADLLTTAAGNARAATDRPILSVRLNRPVEIAVRDSRRTVKVDAAEHVFAITCRDVLWAVIDTGVDGSHAAFAATGPDTTPSGSRVVVNYNISKAINALGIAAGTFTSLLTDDQWHEFVRAADVTMEQPATRFAGLRDDHGTHVAGILGASVTDAEPEPGKPWPDGLDTGEIRGMCPDIRLVDIQVFDQNGNADEFSILLALALVKWMNDRRTVGIGALPPGRKIDGVNLSLSVPFDVDDHACGWTPVCQMCDELVRSGVVVVAAAGNAGFVENADRSRGSGFRLASITDPGNAESVITVGATASLQPHRQGPLARSSKGPTADGRHKPDLLAPGESILGPAALGGWRRETGTSQATAHVSGAAALLIARFPELRGQPGRVKEILTQSATDLRRHRDFQGHGLLDVLRALQST